MAEPSACPACGGSGWLLESREGRKLARSCACRSEALKAGRLSAAQIPPRYQDCNLRNFDERDPWRVQARRAASEFVEAYPFVEQGLLIVGGSGRGKTHLACAVLTELVATKGVSGLYVDFSELLTRIQTSFRPDADASKEAVLSPFGEADLLVLDELGASKPHAWVLDVLYNLLNTRYNRKKLTIATSNFEDEPPAGSGEREKLEDRIGYRLRSRLFEMCLTVPLRGEDYRKDVLSARIRSRF